MSAQQITGIRQVDLRDVLRARRRAARPSRGRPRRPRSTHRGRGRRPRPASTRRPTRSPGRSDGAGKSVGSSTSGPYQSAYGSVSGVAPTITPTRARAARRRARAETSTTAILTLVGPGRGSRSRSRRPGGRSSGGAPRNRRDRDAGERSHPGFCDHGTVTGCAEAGWSCDTPRAPNGALATPNEDPLRPTHRLTGRTAARRAETPARRYAERMTRAVRPTTFRSAGERPHRPRQTVGLVGPAAVRMRGEERRVGLDEELVLGHERGGFAQLPRVPERDRPGEGEHVARVDALPGHRGVAGEAVEDDRRGRALLARGSAGRRRARRGRGSSAACRGAWRARCASGTRGCWAAGGEKSQ